jgi:hypothetical protein
MNGVSVSRIVLSFFSRPPNHHSLDYPLITTEEGRGHLRWKEGDLAVHILA